MQLFQNPLFTFISGIVISVFISGVFYYLQIKRKAKPEWHILSSTPVLANNGSVNKSLKVTYKDRLLDRLTVTTILVLNNGRLALRKNDIVKPITFRLENGVDIIDVINVKKSVDSIKIERNYGVITGKPYDYIQLDINYLNCYDGIMFTVLHTGDTMNCIAAEAEIIDNEFRQMKSTAKPWIGGIISLVSFFIFMFLYKVVSPNMPSFLYVIILLLPMALIPITGYEKLHDLPYWVTGKRKGLRKMFKK